MHYILPIGQHFYLSFILYIAMHLIELKDYALPPTGTSGGLSQVHFSLSSGDVCAIQADSTDDARLFIRGIATLAVPLEGSYFYILFTHILFEFENIVFINLTKTNRPNY